MSLSSVKIRPLHSLGILFILRRMIDSTNFYFQSYEEWRQALTERCKINLTPDYARSRLSALRNSSDPHTQEFTAKYGDAYLQQVIQWFEKAEQQQ